MSKFRMGMLVAFALTFAGTAPAVAHNNLNDWMAMMQRIRQQQQLDARAQVVSPTLPAGQTAIQQRRVKRAPRR